MGKMERANEYYIKLKDSGHILFRGIVGSIAHGTNTENSDIDENFIYILPEGDLYGFDFEFSEHIKLNSDCIGYEIKTFLNLIHTNNPNVLQLLYTPEDCVIYKHPVYQQLIDNRDKFISKICKNSFLGYARGELKRANNLQKKQKREIKEVNRKVITDFCYVLENGGTTSLNKWFDNTNREGRFCGLTKVTNARDVYTLYYDNISHLCFSELIPKSERDEHKIKFDLKGQADTMGYKGVTKYSVSGKNRESNSNHLRLSSIPKSENPLVNIICNLDGYSRYCKDYKEYNDWIKNRNKQRWVDVESHGQKIDGKNLMHCKRLLDISKEIAETGTFNVRRTNREELLDIRKGKVPLEEIITESEKLMVDMGKLFDESNLPDEVDFDTTNDFLIKIRKEFYSQKQS